MGVSLSIFKAVDCSPESSEKYGLRPLLCTLAILLPLQFGCAESGHSVPGNAGSQNTTVLPTAEKTDSPVTTRKLGVPLRLNHRLPRTVEPGSTFQLELVLQGTIPIQQAQLTFYVEGELSLAGKVTHASDITSEHTEKTASFERGTVGQQTLALSLRQESPQTLELPLLLKNESGGYVVVQIQTEAEGIVSRASQAIAVRKGLSAGKRRAARVKGEDTPLDSMQEAKVELPAVEEILPAR